MTLMRKKDLTPIPTNYNGYRFRSRLEARWAVYFDNAGIDWEYEKEGYVVGGVPYLPDFWLPQVNMWAEVKPMEFTKEETQKLIDLVLLTKFGCLSLVGVPEWKPYLGLKYCCSNWNDDEMNSVEWSDYILDDRYTSEKRFYSCTGYGQSQKEIARFQSQDISNWGTMDIREAVTAARSAQFEFLS